ncbi:mannosyltransferase family protein [Propionicicella superfundia]|uniref:mannosyltransferase family protein n=1 Tax=Propionicicella superfundia TaxID=348582 RepID=UPI000684A2D6|nr:mannosyltransferase family protein [Propionicicella superfundia]
MSPARVRAAFSRPDVQLVAQAWAGSRLLIALAAAYVLATRPDLTLRGILQTWDVVHFIRIAEDGYVAANSQAFFPGLPLLLRAGSAVGIDPVVGGVLLSLIGSVLATWALYRLGGPGAAIAWLLAPTAVFTVVGYTESLFCAAAFWAWEFARRRNYLWMAVLAGAAAAIRVSGLFLAGALGILILTQAGDALRRRIARLAWLLVPFGVILAYMVYLKASTGDWMAWYHAQSTGWARSLTNPVQAVINTFGAAAPGAYPDHPEWKWIFRFELVSVVVGVVTTVLCLRRRRWAEAGYVGVQILAFSLSYWFQSVCRAVLLWFPTWILVGEWAERRPETPGGRAARTAGLTVAVVAACAALASWAWLYFNGLWAS